MDKVGATIDDGDGCDDDDADDVFLPLVIRIITHVRTLAMPFSAPAKPDVKKRPDCTDQLSPTPIL